MKEAIFLLIGFLILEEYLKPFLMLLNFWPERIENIGLDDELILDSDISVDQGIVDKLRTI